MRALAGRLQTIARGVGWLAAARFEGADARWRWLGVLLLLKHHAEAKRRFPALAALPDADGALEHALASAERELPDHFGVWFCPRGGKAGA
jgi:hypothetical protein